ncbi:hypothetical protein RRG08_027519 [Elysia crispata]|uniref:SET domain-containing protein n=1 Tax=Elysia crispata TaxID=231223 RepID=A0AAE0YR44_9GAST|nr:hypothetical protein RRG08_027519 [Elysia crispata]
MAASTKRKHEDQSYERVKEKISKGDETVKENNCALSRFTSWCQSNDFQISPKVKVSRNRSCAQWGMHAIEDIVEGYCIFQVPRTALLMPANSDIADLVDIENPKLTSTNQWVPLLLTLLYESSKSDSKWGPYLGLAPDPEAIDLPMFWDQMEVDRLLKGTGVDKAVKRDLKLIKADFNNFVLQFKQNTTGKVREDAISLSSFKRMVAFVMAYSFTEPENKKNGKDDSAENEDEEDEDDEESEKMRPPMMVPMADVLNHITKHNAKLTFGSEALKMVTTRDISMGEEIFNTYGQVSNLHLMHMYGFAERYPENINDVVEIPVNRLLEAAKERSEQETQSKLIESKWQFLKKQEIIDEEDVVIVGRDGILNDDICTQVLKVFCMNPSEFSEYVEKEGWSDAESEASDAETNMLDMSHLPQLDEKQKILLKRMGELHLENYAISLEVAVKKLEHATSLPTPHFANVGAVKTGMAGAESFESGTELQEVFLPCVALTSVDGVRSHLPNKKLLLFRRY